MSSNDELLEQVRTEYLARMTRGQGRLLQHVEQYTAQHVGKMLRPQLTLLCAATLGNEVLCSRRTLLMATCVEMLHNASLLHDDVIDHADTRRGRTSVNAQWNNAVAVLVGDYHLAQIMLLLDEVNDSDAARRINNTVMSMVEAELLQQEVLAGREMSPETYLQIIDGKTANLFATACALGNPQYEEFGQCYGRLFQIYDDMRDGEAPAFATDALATEEARFATLVAPGSIPLPKQIVQ